MLGNDLLKCFPTLAPTASLTTMFVSSAITVEQNEHRPDILKVAGEPKVQGHLWLRSELEVSCGYTSPPSQNKNKTPDNMEKKIPSALMNPECGLDRL